VQQPSLQMADIALQQILHFPGVIVERMQAPSAHFLGRG